MTASIIKYKVVSIRPAEIPLSFSRLLSRNLKVKIYKTIILPVVLNGCESWFLIPRDGHRLRVFENRQKKKEKLHDLYASLHQILFG
jgi:hypothetical protein